MVGARDDFGAGSRAGAPLADQSAADDGDAKRRPRSLVAPARSAITARDSSQRIGVAARSRSEMRGPCRPIVPQRADELAGDAVTERRRRGTSPAQSRKSSAYRPPAFVGSYGRGNVRLPVGTGGQRVFQQPSVERPGAIELTSMLKSLHSSATVSAKRTIAALEAAYALIRGNGLVAPPPESWMILPYRQALKCGSTARTGSTEPYRLISMALTQCSSRSLQ